MRKRWQDRLVQFWYEPNFASYALAPFAVAYQGLVEFRHWLYRKGYKKITFFPVPIIVVGNITVGGTGKTPLVLWLAHFLREQGYHPGIVSRGYGGQAAHYPQIVKNDSDPSVSGDEAVLLARLSECPVVVDPNRVNAVKYLLENFPCDIIISDDGLQHYALGRQIEIAVIDSHRRLGNGWHLPAGPLRESASRLETVDFIVANGEPEQGEYGMQLVPGDIYNIIQPELKAVPNDFAGEAVHAIAGIGHPERFFRTLRSLGLTIWPHRFPDHHQFVHNDVLFESDTKVIMTAKDAVKCEAFADYRYWCLPVTAQIDPPFGEKLLKKLQEVSE